jgi:hypothetical protein
MNGRTAKTNPMATPIRKACQTCTRRKRKCVIELPKCRRCQDKGLACVYDCEPLVTTSTTGSSSDFSGSRSSRHQEEAEFVKRQQRRRRKKGCVAAIRVSSDASDDVSDRRFLEYISSLHLSQEISACGLVHPGLLHSLTAVPLVQDPEAVIYCMGEMLRLPDAVRKGRHALFVHPHLKRSQLAKFFDTTSDPVREWEDRNADSSYESRLGLLCPNACVLSHPITETLAATQALILWLIEHAFSEEVVWPLGRIKDGFINLMKWRHLLFQIGSRGVSDAAPLSPWQSWILAESVRRTILMCYLIEGIYHAWRLGWCTHRMFVYSLPFDTRGAMWHAQSEEEWEDAARSQAAHQKIEAASSRYYPGVGDLASFKEFTLTFANAPFEVGDDLFQRLLLVAHHGRKSVEERLEGIGRAREAETKVEEQILRAI